jgi:hypothetical protein
MDKICLISMYVNDYKNSIARKTHQDYAKKYGYKYLYIEEVDFPAFDFESFKFKKFLIIWLLFKRGYDWVIWIDADAVINENAPSMPKLADIQMVKDRDGFLNFGFGIFKKTDQVENIFNSLKQAKQLFYDKKFNCDLNKISDYIKTSIDVFELSNLWNNMYDLNLKSYITHFSKDLAPLKREKLKLDSTNEN